MIPITYNGNNYIICLNTKLLSLFALFYGGIMFIEGTRYKKYIDSQNKIYLVEA